MIKKKASEQERPATTEANKAVQTQDFKPELTVESLLKPQYFGNPDSEIDTGKQQKNEIINDMDCDEEFETLTFAQRLLMSEKANGEAESPMRTTKMNSGLLQAN